MITDEEYESWFNELEPCCFETENGDKTYYPKEQVDGLVKSMLETITELSIRLDNAEPELKAGLRNLTKRVEELECNLVAADITKLGKNGVVNSSLQK